jgi:hypothetical protein
MKFKKNRFVLSEKEIALKQERGVERLFTSLNRAESNLQSNTSLWTQERKNHNLSCYFLEKHCCGIVEDGLAIFYSARAKNIVLRGSENFQNFFDRYIELRRSSRVFIQGVGMTCSSYMLARPRGANAHHL